MPKNGLIGMAGKISAPTSDGLGVIAIPPVSVDKVKYRVINMQNSQAKCTFN